MPATEVADIAQLRRALNKFSPELYNAMNTEIRGLIRVMQKDARALIPQQIPGLRTGWTDHGKDVKPKSVYRAFPKYNYALAKQGIVIRTGAQKKNRNGFVSYYSLINRSAPGKILETAGRRNPDGRAAVMSTMLKQHGGVVGTTYKKGQGIVRDQSHGFKSNNPFAGYQFVHAIDGVTNFGSIGRGMKNKGRIIYRAAENDQGKTKAAIMKVLDRTRAEFVNNLRKAA
jgi:hypothetical protein